MRSSKCAMKAYARPAPVPDLEYLWEACDEKEPVLKRTGSTHFCDWIRRLLYGEDQVVMIVVRTRGARGRASLIAELRPHRLQGSGG